MSIKNLDLNQKPQRASVSVDLGVSSIRVKIKYENLKGRILGLLDGGERPLTSMFCVCDGKRYFGDSALGTITEYNNQPENIVFDGNKVLTNENSYNRYIWYAKRNAFGEYLVTKNGGWPQQEKYSQPEIIAEFLGNVRERVMAGVCEKGLSVSGPVEIASLGIVVPSFCGQDHRRMILQAAKIAGFSETDTNILLVNQSTAVMTAFKWNFCFEHANEYGNKIEANGNVLVLAIGADSTECSVFAFDDRGKKYPRLLATKGQVGFGGNTFTECLFDETIRHMEATIGKVDGLPKQLFLDVWMGCEEAKIELSETGVMESFTLLLGGANGVRPLTVHYSLETFIRLAWHHFERVQELVGDVLANPAVSRIDHVVFAGGSSRFPFFRQMLHSLQVSPKKVVELCRVMTEEAAVRGALFRTDSMFMERTRETSSLFRQYFLPEYIYTDFSMTAGGVLTNLELTNAPLPLSRQIMVPARKLIEFEEKVGSAEPAKTIEWLVCGKGAEQFFEKYGFCTWSGIFPIVCSVSELGILSVEVQKELGGPSTPITRGLLEPQAEKEAIRRYNDHKQWEAQQKAVEEAEAQKRRAQREKAEANTARRRQTRLELDAARREQKEREEQKLREREEAIRREREANEEKMREKKAEKERRRHQNRLSESMKTDDARDHPTMVHHRDSQRPFAVSAFPRLLDTAITKNETMNKQQIIQGDTKENYKADKEVSIKPQTSVIGDVLMSSSITTAIDEKSSFTPSTITSSSNISSNENRAEKEGNNESTNFSSRKKERQKNNSGNGRQGGGEGEGEEKETPEQNSAIIRFEAVKKRLQEDMPQLDRELRQSLKKGNQCAYFSAYESLYGRMCFVADKLRKTSALTHATEKTQQFMGELEAGTTEMLELAEKLALVVDLVQSVCTVYDFVQANKPQFRWVKWLRELNTHWNNFRSKLSLSRDTSRDDFVDAFVVFCDSVGESYIGKMKSVPRDTELREMLADKRAHGWLLDRYIGF